VNDLGQLLDLSLSKALSTNLSSVEQVGRKLHEKVPGIAASAQELAAFGPCPERFPVQA
jgi:hypothetical protein